MASSSVVKTSLAASIVRYVDDHQPGWVEVQFVDADGKRHTLVDKVPAFTAVALQPYSVYPQAGSVRCEVVSQSTDAAGRILVRISTAYPDAIKSIEGLSEFVVLSTQLSD